MQTLRKWMPPPAPLARTAAPGPLPVDCNAISGRDIAFCAEFAVHGGVAERREGFDAEADLVRMQAAGLVTLTRSPEPPFVITRVKLTNAAREFVSRGSVAARMSSAGVPAPPPTPPEARSRRNGFETARAMITSALKAELDAARHGDLLPELDELERRLLSRVDAVELPALRLSPAA